MQALAIMPTGTCLKRGELVSLRTNSLAQGPKANQPLGRCVLCLTNQGPKRLTCEFHILTIILRSQGCSEQLPRNGTQDESPGRMGGVPFRRGSFCGKQTRRIHPDECRGDSLSRIVCSQGPSKIMRPLLLTQNQMRNGLPHLRMHESTFLWARHHSKAAWPPCDDCDGSPTSHKGFSAFEA